MKYEVAEELGYFQHQPDSNVRKEYDESLDQMKYNVADSLGIQMNHGYNGDMKTKDAGRIGGQMGGHIGGQMVKKMIEYAETKMAEEYGKQQGTDSY
ncbi:MAG: alpha/beta-type small acid-soluble spore protein [Halanaerobiales bacterium]|nr:alpha/beta-type small acid-soluble spore protein [Halanaerobiales bacterium]